MATRRRDPGGSWWWPHGDGGGAEEGLQADGGGEFAFDAMCENERRQREQMAALGGYQLQEVGMAAAQQNNPQQIVDADIFQLSYPRPRLRWTAELHDQFVKAVDELGGASKATPKAIWNLMGVQGLTLYHLKSHLQKFRLGKTGRKLWKKDFIPANYYRKDDRDRLPPMNQLEAQAPSSFSNVFDTNSVSHEYMGNTLGAEAYGNMHLLAEPQPQPQPQPQPPMENFEMSGLNTFELAEYSATAAATTTITSSSVKLEEEFGGVRPALLPLFPPIPACGMMDYSDQEWPEYHVEGGGGGGGGGSALPVENAVPMDDDDYLNSLGYSSSESCRASMIVGTFFDEVASFSKVDADLTAAHDVIN